MMNITCATSPFLFSLTDSYTDEHYLCYQPLPIQPHIHSYSDEY